MDKTNCLAALFLLLACLPAPGGAETEAPLPGLREKWAVSAILERNVNSWTSYEFGNPFEPFQAPLSRLEFPLNVWWGGVDARRHFARGSIGARLLTNLTQSPDHSMRDSDWEDEAMPTTLTTYSESHCRVEPGVKARFDVDLFVADWLNLPLGLDIRPVVGFEWQRFNLMAHDGWQWERDSSEPPLALPGNSLHFRQEYQLAFLGLRATYRWGHAIAGRHPEFLLFGYHAIVQADNEDHHLLRPGLRLTMERTSGRAWFISGGLRLPVFRRLSVLFETAHLNIRTTGSHHLQNTPFGIDKSFEHGVKVYSRQTTLGLRMEYVF